MEERTTRNSLSGVANIVRFNWPMFVVAIVVMGSAVLAALSWHPGFWLVAAGVAVSTGLSLLVSAWVYDFSGLAGLPFLESCGLAEGSTVLNITAGFDEYASGLPEIFPGAEIKTLDFYDPRRHTEASIQRARDIYPPPSGALTMTNGKIPLRDGSIDLAVALMSVHEIRSAEERDMFLKEVSRIVKETGRIVIVEHLRDGPNFFAYNMGAFHFHRRSSWLADFDAAGLHLVKESRHTPFLAVFTLEQ